MLSEELSTDMDRITQLQDAILDAGHLNSGACAADEQLLTISHTSIEYITKRTQFEQTSLEIPQTLSTPLAAPRQEYKDAIQTFVKDLVRRSKDVEKLIAALPNKDDSTERAARLRELQGEMVTANAEYKAAVKQAEDLLKELQDALALALGDGTSKSPLSMGS